MNWQGAVVNVNILKSKAKALTFAALIATAAGSYARAADLPIKNPPPPKPVPFFFVNDTSVSFTWYFNATDPGVSGSSGSVAGGIAGTGFTTPRVTGSIDHFDVWEYGTNLIHIDLNQYGKEDPEQGQPGAAGAREFFGFTRSTIGWNELTHSKMFTTFLTNDIGFEGGFTAGTEDNVFASQTTQYVAGLNFDLAIPKVLGTMLVGVLAYKEFAHNEFAACNPGGPAVGLGSQATQAFTAGACPAAPGASFSGDRDFEWTWKIEAFNSIPLGGILGSWADAAHVINILNVTGPKGTGISNANLLALGPFGGFCCGLPASMANQLANNETKTEVFEDARLSIDTSKIFWGKPGIWDSYVGYRYWFNKFGADHNAPLMSVVAPGTAIESTVYLGTTYHFK